MAKKELNKNEALQMITKLLKSETNFKTLHRNIIRTIDYLPEECQRLFYQLYSYEAFKTQNNKLLKDSLIIAVASLFVKKADILKIKHLKFKALFFFSKRKKRY